LTKKTTGNTIKLDPNSKIIKKLKKQEAILIDYKKSLKNKTLKQLGSILSWLKKDLKSFDTHQSEEYQLIKSKIQAVKQIKSKMIQERKEFESKLSDYYRKNKDLGPMVSGGSVLNVCKKR
jgi:hypothetical protein